jgi:YVTN family beta-propeller protein
MVIGGSNNVTSTISVGSYPEAIAVIPATNKVYVGNYSDNTVTVIDGATNSTSTVPVGRDPLAIALNQVTNKIYVGSMSSYTVSVIDRCEL